MERFINILIIDSDENTVRGLKSILNGGGNNVISVPTEEEANTILNKRDIGIILVSASEKEGGVELLRRLKQHPKGAEIYKIVITDEIGSGTKLVKGFREGAVDHIIKPFNPNLVKAKIEVFKALFFKDQRINQLLTNIFPQNVLEDLNVQGKFSPQRIEEGTVLFTDFVAFTKIAKRMLPLELLKRLETYFNKFDEIIDRYQLEKIKTIGDAYMALSGVTEKNSKPAVRACLAALEMRDYMVNEKLFAQATGKDYWEIRIGIHSGPLVAGIIGAKKISFDVWGDTVNIAARAEHHSVPNGITITDRVAGHAIPYFNLEHRGEIDIKHGGAVDMYFLNNLKGPYSLFEEGKLPSSKLRKGCGLMTMDFEHARRTILNRLKSSLPDELTYHDIKHTLNVEKAAQQFARLEGIKGEELVLLRTAVLFHDAGYILTNEGNEEIAIKLMRSELPNFGYTEKQIQQVAAIIRATIRGTRPTSLLEMIMCDADHDYLGRADYHAVASKLRIELEEQGKTMTDIEWVKFQLNYLENEHEYYTETAQNIRNLGKSRRIAELKNQLNELTKGE
ncbi:MAG: adenylate/guanylate cyclase domain-containing protein [Crocinitomicaceae bacterium]|nr:adenylate/guanylate cyclase domain-containing protein [Crocinitomicaceae bacterium]